MQYRFPDVFPRLLLHAARTLRFIQNHSRRTLSHQVLPRAPRDLSDNEFSRDAPLGGDAGPAGVRFGWLLLRLQGVVEKPAQKRDLALRKRFIALFARPRYDNIKRGDRHHNAQYRNAERVEPGREILEKQRQQT